MHKRHFFILKFIILVFILNINYSCKKEINHEYIKGLNLMSDSLFITNIKRDRVSNSLLKIDSLFGLKKLSEHKEAILYLKKGANLFEIDQEIEALASLNKAKSAFKNNKSLDLLAETNLYLAKTNASLNNLDSAKQNITEAFNYFEKQANRKDKEAETLNVLANVNFLQDDFILAITNLEKAVSIQKERNDTFKLAQVYSNIGLIYYYSKNIPNAIEYLNKSINILKTIENFNSTSYKNLSNLYLKLEQYSISKELLLEALIIEKRANKILLQKETYNDLILVSLKQELYDDILFYIEQRDSIKNVISKLEEEQKIALIEKKYKLINNEKELSYIKNKNKIILISLLSFIVMIGLLLYFKNKYSKLKHINEKTALEQTILRSQMNPHFIFNVLSTIQNSLLDNNPIQSASYISKFAKLIRQNFDFISKERISLEEEIDALKNYMDTQKIRFNNKFQYEINVEESIDLSENTIPPLLLQPFIENAIEHGFKNKKEVGLVILSISEQGENLHFNITDNGCGFNIQDLDKEIHSVDVFKKRLKLMGINIENAFKINSSSNGTSIDFFIKKVSNF